MVENGFQSVLVIEDTESKWVAVESALFAIDNISVVRAPTVREAEHQISKTKWDLIVLDVSMDIATNTAGTKRVGHDPQGGLHIANKMFLLGHESPTLILTAFDSFPPLDTSRVGAQILGLEDVEARARDTLGSSFLGCVRYGVADWQIRFLEAVQKALSK